MNPAETPITENAHDIASLCVFGDMRDDGLDVSAAPHVIEP